MQRYPVRASHRTNLSLDLLESLCRTHFDEAERTDQGVRARFGAIQSLVVRPQGRELTVELTMDPKVEEAVARETIQRYNRFLEATTGFSGKERARRLRKFAGG